MKVRKWLIWECKIKKLYNIKTEKFENYNDDCLIDKLEVAKRVGSALRSRGFETEVVPQDIESWEYKGIHQAQRDMENLEEENRVLKRALELACETIKQLVGRNKELRTQLAEKDKKIEYLKRKWDITKDCLKRKEEELPHHDKMLCHQICEKIREWYREQELIMEEWLIDCLDQIEKGEEK